MIKPKKQSPSKGITTPVVEIKIEKRGGARKGAGAKKHGKDKKRRGFYCYVTELKAEKVGKGNWKKGVKLIQIETQQTLDKRRF